MSRRVSPRPSGEELARLQQEERNKKMFNMARGKRQRIKVVRSSICTPQEERKGKRVKKKDYIIVDPLEGMIDDLIREVRFPKYRIYNK